MAWRIAVLLALLLADSAGVFAGASENCPRCHGQALLRTRDVPPASLQVDGPAYERSAHGRLPCTSCHQDLEGAPSPHPAPAAPVRCAGCHAAQAAVYDASLHGQALARGNPAAPGCSDCHGKHDVLSSRRSESPTYVRNVPVLCGRCHREGPFAPGAFDRVPAQIPPGYAASIHGEGLYGHGLNVTAVCTSCHTAHDVRAHADPASSIHPDRLSETCGHCHEGIANVFAASVHARRAGEKRGGLPTCEDCHSSHAISRTDGPGFRLVMMQQCGRCHAKDAETFFDTFHGKVSRLGEDGAARCSDCHGTHDILPAADPRSTLSHENVVGTCARCHPGSHRGFVGYLTHATHQDRERYPWLFWAYWGMTALLVGTLSVAFLHALAWLGRLWLSRSEWRARRVAQRGESGQARVFCRFDRSQRAQHLLLLISFFALALTGMALKFSYAPWARGLSWAFGGFEVMGVLHRCGAVLMITVFVFHLADVWRRVHRGGVGWLETLAGPDSVLFNRHDWPELMQSVRWFLGRGPRPAYGRFTYWEKFDYFAVFWGVLVIGGTGLLLWFPTLFTRVLPGWSVNVATIVHSDEALLAVGFIFTIHFFNAHFRPDKFPMDPVIFTGRMSVAELEYERPAQHRALVEQGDLERHLVEPVPADTERRYRALGMAALALGLAVIVGIVYALIAGRG